MVIRKEDLVDFITAEQKEVAKKIEEQIDKALKERYLPPQTLSVALKTHPSERVKKEIIKRYEGAGWDIEFKSSQRDGEEVALS